MIFMFNKLFCFFVCPYVVWAQFGNVTRECGDNVSTVLQQLYSLYVLDCIEKDASYFLCSGLLTTDKMKQVGPRVPFLLHQKQTKIEVKNGIASH